MFIISIKKIFILVNYPCLAITLLLLLLLFYFIIIAAIILIFDFNLFDFHWFSSILLFIFIIGGHGVILISSKGFIIYCTKRIV